MPNSIEGSCSGGFALFFTMEWYFCQSIVRVILPKKQKILEICRFLQFPSLFLAIDFAETIVFFEVLRETFLNFTESIPSGVLESRIRALLKLRSYFYRSTEH